MCTVTFLPIHEGYILTSNRDEQHTRKHALPPKTYQHGLLQITYPKDQNANGTWIASKNNGETAVLLNGAIHAHIPNPPYRRSRGLVFLDLLASNDPVFEFENYNLFGIEPFTIIFACSNHLYECRWDGQKRSNQTLDASLPYIWSSATLYNQAISSKRKKWFENWLEKNNLPNQQAIIDFHCFTGDGDSHNDLIMNRENQVSTVSISSIMIHNREQKFTYHDLKNDQNYTLITNHLQERLIENTVL